ncbi:MULTISPECIES: ABC transporter substrate-binding protein [unclassified Caballeronia]|uniref:ABC transporter substrate-binding protein n=1 Tax=unclassified Caballeronia TaxID=2646786 RepID=UPI00253FFA0F|nr:MULTISPECIES: ABC transporter substrate-binding protein [unclassified Caballeronia]
MKTSHLVITFGLLAGMLTSANAKDSGQLRFGVDATYPPYESKAADGHLVGFDIDLGNEICKRLMVQCVWVESEFSGMIPALKAKKFDAVLSSMSITPQRAEQIAFTDKLYSTSSRLIARKGAPILPTPEALVGKSIGVEQGTVQETYAKKYWQPKGATVVSYQTQDQVYADLVSGRLDASLQYVIQAQIGFLGTARGAGFEFAGPTLVDAQILGNGSGIGLRKDDEDLKSKINKAIAEMLKDGTYRSIEKKYFNVDVYGS